MSDAEIIKALECCADLENHYCAIECVYWNKGCDEPLMKDTLNLINRQKEEKTVIQHYIDHLQAEIESWQGGYMTQKQEIANLETQLKTLRKEKNKLMDAQMLLAKTSDEQQAENERLQDAIDEQDIEIASLWKRIEDAKSEARKEFAKELHYKAMRPEDICDEFAIECNALDNLLKEMDGANND